MSENYYEWVLKREQEQGIYEGKSTEISYEMCEIPVDDVTESQ